MGWKNRKPKGEIPSDGSEGTWAKRSDKRMNYGKNADKYLDKKYEPPEVKRRASTEKPPT